MKKILFITSNVPSDVSAGDKTTKILLKELSESYLVDLIYFKYERESIYVPESININTISIVPISKLKKIINFFSFPFVHPMFSVRFNWYLLYQFKKILKKNNYSGIVLDYSQTFLYGKFFKHDIPIFLYSMDVLAQKISRKNGGLMAKLCMMSENYCLNIPNSYIYTVSKKDCQLIKDLYGLPSNEALAYIEEKIIEAKPSKIDENSFVFMGVWTRPENLEGLEWFFKNVVPLIDFDVTIKVIGKYLPTDSVICSNPHVSVDILGFVDDPYPIISNCRAFLSPLFNGAGVKQKVFEALACGTPVIGNDIAFEGIDTKYQKYMFRFISAQDFLECMKIAIPIEERIDLKNRFSHDYRSKTIPQYIKEIIG